MMQKSIFILVVFLSLFIAPSLIADEFEGKIVKEIQLIPNVASSGSKFNKKTVLNSLQTREGTSFSQADFDKDLKNLYERFDNIDPYVKIVDDGLKITINFDLKPKIRTITWTGNEKLKTSKLKKELGIEAKSTFNKSKFNKGFQKLKALYIKKGYFEADLKYEVTKIKETQEVDIEVIIDEGRSSRIKKIIFKGFTKEEKKNILDIMVTKTYFPLTGWMNNAGTYNKDAVEYDKINILKELHKGGYADARVDIKIVETRRKNRVNIIVSADKGKKYYFGKISFQGNKLFDDDKIRKTIAIKEGDLYSPERLQEISSALKDIYGYKGYIEAFVDYNTSQKLKKVVYDVEFTISEGKKFKVGLIKIFGNTVTQERVILHETPLIPGEVFNSHKLKVTENKLLAIDYFENVNVYTVQSEVGTDFKDVHIEVKEKGTGSLNFSVGFSTNSSLFGSIGVAERNFNYKGFSRVFKDGLQALRGGGEYAKADIFFGVKRRNYAVSWAKPHFMDSKWTVGFKLERLEDEKRSHLYSVESWGLSLYGIYHFNDYLKLDLTYRLNDANIVSRDDIDKIESPSLKEEIKNSGLLSGLSTSLVYDSTDFMYDPRTGIRSSVGAEYVGLGGKFNFLKLFYNNSLYFSPFKKGALEHGTFKLLANVQFIQPLGSDKASNIPIHERFFLGGDDTVRGYRYNHIGPMYEGTKNPEPRGGISSLLLSAEFVYRFHKMIDGFAHADAGAVSFKAFDINTLRCSVGVGARIKVLGNVPIVVGYAIPINRNKKLNRADRKNFYVSIGFGF